ncbi:MAG: phosphomethylpyrimidine synthase ThiC [Xylanivirga thermophila]|jgi:phosphomethylpyrimidine synthase|uniref:phosphomethylpyrimidine synthase ThiC n=1 Tax=Xylanivirga thermophila TaxID=2496273 RepID=UPI00101DE147|nr:phosphomethylpyrimidine synthase ThiC [Xylanivirga thermophila]
MNYTTQMDAAKKGIITGEMKIVSKKENMDVKLLMERIAAGTAVIPANKNHRALDPEGIGQGLKTKINVNLGVSKDCCSIDAELEKVKKAIEMKAESIMDLSSYGKTEEFRTRLIDMSTAIVGTVPVYDAMGFYDKELQNITSDEFIKVIEKHAQDGVDFITIHSGINRDTIKTFKENERLLNIVSRGGSLIYAWMELNKKENPFYEYFDEILDICAEYDVTISLGDACRPGSIYDSTDASQVGELIVLGELTRRAWEKNVQVIIEGPGHMKLNEIATNVMLEKKLCGGAPFYVLGPIVTDIAPGYDHITSAIGGAIAAANGADFLCYVTPAEHLRLPNLDDMKEGIIATKIAAHSGDLAKGIDGVEKWDYKMSCARRELDWEKMFELSIDPEKARRYRKESIPEEKDSCTMCGKICAVRNMNKLIKGEGII